MRRQKLNVDPDLGDLEEMLAHVQTQIEYEIELEKDQNKMPSITNIEESPKPKRTSSFNKADTFTYRRTQRPPLVMNEETTSLNNYNEYQQPSVVLNGLRGSSSSLMSDEVSLRSFRSEPNQRLSVTSLPDKRGSSGSLNGRSRTATLPRGRSKEKWEDYWAQ